MENWLRCDLSVGQFEGEYGVDGLQFNDTVFSLFVPADAVRCHQEPTKEKTAPGSVKVEVLEREGDLVLVRLPRSTFQNGPFVTVKASQLELPLSTPRKPAHKG